MFTKVYKECLQKYTYKQRKMLKCYVLGCDTTDKNNPDKLDFYKISQNLKEKWCKAIGRDPDKCNNEYICSKHFRISDFYFGKMSKRLILKPDVVPTEKLEYIKTADDKFVPIDIQNISNTSKGVLRACLAEPPPLKLFSTQNKNDTNSLAKSIIKKSDDIKIVKVKNVDKSYERRRGVIQIFPAADVASDLESTESEYSAHSEISSSEDSDCEDPLKIPNSQSKRKNVFNDKKESKKQCTGTEKSTYLNNVNKNRNSNLQINNNSVQYCSDDSNCVEIATDTEINTNKKNTSKLSSSNENLRLFENPLTNEKIQVIMGPSLENEKTINISKNNNDNITNIPENIKTNEQYILIKPDNIHNITTEKIQKCIAILSEDDDALQDLDRLCINCKKVKIQSIEHDHLYSPNPMDKDQHKKLQERIKKQSVVIKTMREKIRTIFKRLDQQEELLAYQNEVLDRL